jgi:hypothetical protein
MTCLNLRNNACLGPASKSHAHAGRINNVQPKSGRANAHNVPYVYAPFEGQFHAFDYFKDTTDRSLYFIEKFLAEYL